ncbi:unnamed protein product [Toxocara canis]|uniref:Transporter n=1 Tax=Toxocara canis TaxID=6265 RepID=A0A183VGN9_TOXCA|nr:unnamed protein product [Toxocara canis]
MTPPGLMFLMYAVIFARFRKMKIAAVAGTVSTGELQLNDGLLVAVMGRNNLILEIT